MSFLEYRHVIYNKGTRSEVFRHDIEKHLGRAHTISSDEGKHYRVELVGFGGQTWRGRFFYENNGGFCRAFELVPNFECQPERITMATCGLAVLIFQDYALLTDVLIQ